MRTTQEMREYQRKRRALLRRLTPPKQQERNQVQQEAVKTIGGRQRYFACQKTKVCRLGAWAFPMPSYKHNGALRYGYTI